MTQNYALLSIVFMMVFVILFDRTHRNAQHARFCKDSLLSPGDVDRLRSILLACQEG